MPACITSFCIETKMCTIKSVLKVTAPLCCPLTNCILNLNISLLDQFSYVQTTPMTTFNLMQYYFGLSLPGCQNSMLWKESGIKLHALGSNGAMISIVSIFWKFGGKYINEIEMKYGLKRFVKLHGLEKSSVNLHDDRCPLSKIDRTWHT